MDSILLRRLYLFGLPVLIIGIVIIYYFYDPNKYSFFPECPFHKLTGLNCPGCGAQRAIHNILMGNFKMAMHYNLLLVLSIPFLLVQLGYKLASIIKQKDIRWALIYHPITPKIIFVLVIAFAVVRNIPLYPFNYLNI